MQVLSCITAQHELWIVLLAALVCAAGSFVAFELYHRAIERSGRQRTGWLFLTAVAAGSTVWCTHFTAILAHNPGVQMVYDPLIMGASLLIAINGIGLALHLTLSGYGNWAPALGGALVGAAVAAMHYSDTLTVKFDGIVTWRLDYVALSLVAAVAPLAWAFDRTVRGGPSFRTYQNVAVFSGAVIALHFLGMTAMSITPFDSLQPEPTTMAWRAMAVVVAGVGLIVVGTAITSYLIDGYASCESLIEFRRLALTDVLTGLPNRAAFRDEITTGLDRARSEGRQLAVIGIDLDRFKEINDTHGHEVGDTALRTTGQRLGALLQPGEFVARIGGDEFAALKQFDDKTELKDFVSRLEASLFQPICLDACEVTTGASVGVSIFPHDGENIERLVSNADLAMYRAKDDVAHAVLYYESQMDEVVRDRRELGQDLRRAIELKQLELYYQVQTSVATGEIIGYEVLLRWHHPVRGMVPPSEFIPVAEQTGAIIAIGEWVLRTACKTAATWPKPHRIAVNLSPVQFQHADLARLVHEILLETGLSARRLELEITESTIIADKRRTLHTLRQIKALGVTVAIDDFGVGYSSLDTLRTFPFDKIKLDRSFMQEVEHSAQAKTIVRAMLTLGKTLGILVLAEGVETRSQLALLADEACDEAQGYYIGRPGPEAAIIEAHETISDHAWLMIADERDFGSADEADDDLIRVA